MRIVLDVSPLSLPRTGIGNYVRGMLAGLADVAGDRHELVAFAPSGPWGKRRIEAALEGLPLTRRLPVLPRAHWWRTAWSRLGRPPVERVVGPLDVFHFSDWMYPPQRGGLRVTTIYDLIPLRFPDWVHPRTRRMHSAKYANAARTCDRIFAISEFTARDVHERLGVPRERISVAYPGVDEVFRQDGNAATLDGRYVVTVAGPEPRKNLESLLIAFGLLRRRLSDLMLAVVGADERWEPRRAVPLDGVRLLGYRSDDQLAALCRGAGAFVYPSSFEGFGMPIVEAMASETPVVASNHASLDEASGGAALRASPEHPESLADALQHALENPDPLVERGRRHAAKFTWRACGEAVLAGYESA